MQPPPPPSPPPPKSGDIAPLKNLDFLRTYIRELTEQGAMDQEDAQVAVYCLDQLEQPPTIGIDSMLSDHSTIQIRMAGLTGKYLGKTNLAKEEREKMYNVFFRGFLRDENIKGQGRMGICKTHSEGQPQWIALNDRAAKFSAVFDLFNAISWALKDRKDILVQESKNQREDK